LAEKTYNTIRTYTGDGNQTTYNFGLPFLRKTFITANINGVAQVYGTDYTVDATEEITFTTAPSVGALIVIKRITSTAPLVTWNDGSVLLAKDLTLQETQLLHIQEEMNDAVQTDAAENADLAKAYADNAKVSETNAKTSETNAKLSEDISQAAAALGVIYKEAAKTSETNAKTSETNAGNSESNALNSKNAAKVSEDNAKVSETNAVAAEAIAVAAKNVIVGNTVYVPTYPVGVPFPWVSSAARPDGTLLCDGSAFSTSAYPKLALVFPSGVLPDFRGVVPRGLDHARGLDIDGAGRVIGSYQPDAEQGHAHAAANFMVMVSIGSGGIAASTGNNVSTSMNTQGVITDGTHGTPRVSDESRMKNIAVDWLVYATTLQYDLTVAGGNAAQLGGYPASHFASVADSVGSRLWVSPLTAFAINSTTTFTHGLTISDKRNVSAQIGIQCITADVGYAVGDVVMGVKGALSGGIYYTAIAPWLTADTTALKIPWLNSLAIQTPTFSFEAITPTKWQCFAKLLY
jgi:hypothetical protein